MQDTHRQEQPTLNSLDRAFISTFSCSRRDVPDWGGHLSRLAGVSAHLVHLVCVAAQGTESGSNEIRSITYVHSTLCCTMWYVWTTQCWSVCMCVWGCMGESGGGVCVHVCWCVHACVYMHGCRQWCISAGEQLIHPEPPIQYLSLPSYPHTTMSCTHVIILYVLSAIFITPLPHDSPLDIHATVLNLKADTNKSHLCNSYSVL